LAINRISVISDLSGSQDGSIFMWEFANARPIVTHKSSGSSVTKIRFTQQGNKFGVGDVTGKLHLWQGLHSNEKGPYQVCGTPAGIINKLIDIDIELSFKNNTRFCLPLIFQLYCHCWRFC